MSYRNEETGSVLTLTAAAAGTNSANLDVAYGKGIILFINVSAITGTSPTLTVTLQGRDGVSGAFYTILASAALSATGLTVLRVFPGIAAVANVSASDIIPPTCRISTAIAGTTPAVTATINAVVVE